MSGVRLVPAQDADFAWLLGTGDAHPELRIAPGGAGDPLVLAHVRRIAAGLQIAGWVGSWIIVHDDEVVGMCGFHRPPSARGEVEIGYHISESRQGRGYMTAAITALLAIVARDARIATVLAETVADNLASQAVLRANGFAREGMREDAQDGTVIRWTFTVACNERQPVSRAGAIVYSHQRGAPRRAPRSK